jgi:hypothetical protein
MLTGIDEEVAWARQAVARLSGDEMTGAVRDATEAMQGAAVAEWDATAGLSRRNAGYRTTHRTQRYREAIRQIFFDDGHTGKVFVSYPVESGRGARPKLLPVWLEYGTALMSRRPHLVPAWRMAVARFNARIEAVLRTLGD